MSDAVSQANAGQFSKIVVSGNQLSITKKGAHHATLKAYDDPNCQLKRPGPEHFKSPSEL